jgi:hypothetical protein
LLAYPRYLKKSNPSYSLFISVKSNNRIRNALE